MAPAEPPTARRPPGRETVLLVEDSDIVREVVKQMLVQRGFAVIEAENGEKALEICRSHGGTIDMLLTDVVMPNMNGGELARSVAALRPFTRVLYMSGYADSEIGREGELPEGTHYIQKPFTPDDLIGKIREVLGES